MGKEYYENGKLRAEVNFKDGKQDGVTKLYDEEGALRSEYTYKDGVEVSRKVCGEKDD
jgi:antitoxin component YwqK of YwqJK toxin-antitoxin module